MARFSLPGLSLPGITRDEPGQSALSKWGPTLANVVLVAIAAWLATTWFWHFWPQEQAAPAPAQRERTVPIAAVAETVAAAQLFGAAPVAQGPVAPSTLNVKLKGVFASRENMPASAIVNTGQKDEFVRTGNEVVPGVVLEAVYPTHVILKRNGRLERVNMEERIAGGGGARIGMPQRVNPQPQPQPQILSPSPPVAAQPQPAPIAPPPPNIPPGMAPIVPGVPGGAGAAQGAAAQTPNLGRVTFAAGGLTVQEAPPGSLLDRFGLQPGDVIKSVNGAPISGQGDIARIYAQASSGQAVQGEIVRAGKTLPITIAVKH